MTRMVQETERVPGRRPVRIGALSGVLRWRPLLALFGSAVVLLLMFLLNVGLGDYPIGPGRGERKSGG